MTHCRQGCSLLYYSTEGNAINNIIIIIIIIIIIFVINNACLVMYDSL